MVFSWENKEKQCFGADIRFLGLILPENMNFFLWICSLMSNKFYMKVSTLTKNFHFKFFEDAIIIWYAMNKKMNFSRFWGPFWTFLGTWSISQDHDFLFLSLSHQEVSQSTILGCWDQTKKKILTKNAKMWQFLHFSFLPCTFKWP